MKNYAQQLGQRLLLRGTRRMRRLGGVRMVQIAIGLVIVEIALTVGALVTGRWGLLIP